MRALALTRALLLSVAFAAPALGADHPLCTAANEQTFPQIASDGAGGAIVAWYDGRNGNTDLYAQHVLSTGVVDPAWPTDGRALCTAAGNQINHQIVSDMAGGAIVAWEDARFGVHDIYAQHVLASGAVDPAWPLDGQAVCTAMNDQEFPVLVSDGAGGAIVTWEDNRSGKDIYAQRVLASGALDAAWPVNGLALCTAIQGQGLPDIVSDGAGGAIVVWHDLRVNGANTDIYAQHALASGAVDPAWPANGRALCTATKDQSHPKILLDGAGGAIVTWEDYRNARSGGSSVDIYAQHVSLSGVVDPLWPTDGIAVCTAASFQQTPHLASDGAGGAIVAWDDFRDSGFIKVYAQHALAGGTVDAAWPANGRLVCVAANSQTGSQIVTDGSGGAIVAWLDVRDGVNGDIYAQHVLASGVLDTEWTAGGRGVCTATGDQKLPVLASDGAGRAIVTWVDDRNGPASDIYAERTTVWTSGVWSGNAPGELKFAAPAPNPARTMTTLRYELSREEPVRLGVYDVAGRLVRELANGARGPGAHSVGWDLHDASGRAVRAGLYFARLEAQGWAQTRRLAVIH